MILCMITRSGDEQGRAQRHPLRRAGNGARRWRSRTTRAAQAQRGPSSEGTYVQWRCLAKQQVTELPWEGAGC